jgi:RND family efflux transporter MFP subunit
MASPLYPRMIIGVIAVALTLVSCSDAQKVEKKEEIRTVLVQPVRLAPRVTERTFVASIRPRIETDLGFRVSGKVAKRLVEVGDVVKAGQPLAILDETDLRLQKEQAEAEVKAAMASVVQAEADLKRITTLRAEGWSAAANLDKQRAAAEEARGRLLRGQRSLSLSANALSYASLNADAAGAVTLVSIEPGQVISAGQPAIKIAQRDGKEAVIAVPETLVEWVKSGEAKVSLWSAPDRFYEAGLREMSPSADAATRTYQARFSLKNGGEEVKNGMTAMVFITEPAREHVYRVPLSALFNQGGGAMVWVASEQGELTLKPVTVSAYESREVLISQGLLDGDLVVTLGVHKLDKNQKVRPIQKLDF